MLQDDDVQAVQKLNEAYRLITEQLGRVIVGQQQVIEELLVAMFAKGHVLLEGVPGLAKTLMIRTLSDALSLGQSMVTVNRISCPPLKVFGKRRPTCRCAGRIYPGFPTRLWCDQRQAG